MSSRNPNNLTIEMFKLWKAFDVAMLKAGIKYTITSVDRTEAEQQALYAQGRQTLAEVNSLRISVGWAVITEAENKKVTWTLNSKHITNSEFPKSRAFDIVILKSGKACYDIKVDVNQNNIPDYMEAGKIGKQVGLKWGGDFSKPDYPHFEI